MTQNEFQTVNNQTYFIARVEVITMPLKKKGYFVAFGKDKFVFVDSRLSTAERKAVISSLMQSRKGN